MTDFLDLSRIEWRVGHINDLPTIPPSRVAGLFSYQMVGDSFNYALHLATRDLQWITFYPFIIQPPNSAFSNGFSNGYADTPTSIEKVGVIQLYAGTTAPNGFLICDGSAISRTVYARLFNFAVVENNIGIGLLFGDGDGSTTFELPDLSTDAPVGTIYIIKD